MPSIVCLLLALQWGGSTYAWGNWRIILLFVLFAVLFIVFACIQVFMPNTATVPVRIISQRSIAAATVFMLAVTGAMLMTVYYLPLWCKYILSRDTRAPSVAHCTIPQAYTKIQSRL